MMPVWIALYLMIGMAMMILLANAIGAPDRWWKFAVCVILWPLIILGMIVSWIYWLVHR